MGKQSTTCRLIALNCRYTHSCLALFYLRNELEQNLPGITTELLQLTINDPYYPALLRITEDDPEILFFSAYIWNGEYLRRLLIDLAKIRPGIPMVIGGPQAEFLGTLPAECTLIRGAIEEIDSVFYHDLTLNTLRPLYIAPQTAPFPFPYRRKDFDTHLQNRQILYESSRGCPFSCSYCLSATSTRVIHKEVLQVEEELRQILTTRPTLVKFVDRTFNDNPDRAMVIWRFLVDCKAETRFHFEIAPDKFTAEMLDFLATVPVGLFQFEIGIQSTDPVTLAAVHRKMNVEQAIANIHRLALLQNIHLHVDLILGLPEDTMQSFADSFRRTFSALPHHIQMGLLKVLPGTPITGDIDQYQLLYCNQPPFEILSTKTMDREKLAELYLFGECVERFYNNRYFPSLYRYLVFLDEDSFAFFKCLLTLCKKKAFFQRAATQELMNELLVEFISTRNDSQLLRELLCYDWLRCGHRFLPGCLNSSPLAELRTRLRKTMPQALEPHYTSLERNRFFKQGNFYIFSAAALEHTGLHTETTFGVVCFQAERDSGLHRWSRTVLLPVAENFF